MTDLSLREQIEESIRKIYGVDDVDSVGKAADAIHELIKGAVPVWQPIETAPKDGTPILTYSGGCDDRNEAYLVMWWTADKAERCGFGWEAYEVDHMLSPDLWIHLEPGAVSILAALGVK
ncbi:hypothetical protein [Phaeobacter gallaeciensis]|uniref:hypothetical protein n=1 Tax=Phaeobacter gallaeciensis TaxID=60890 RepID=UPI00237EF3FD|nr:hypothetical protein [Phaeobacter gallaeciensis]MDE4189619.1 hypothetical protein [Phaeobacter gallaeciensis]MDE4198771.1 hypothetical protein [Phaeobacter gallaeciensis]MDE4202916.1 hypothetical protein [Phaeobacter gallaeciensis]MDE4207060.1 hypothetical protein [Phaeobacter gallaeciensis]MDE4215715.1 hypothetical protein [Phaeobacter gallaeciensis]